MHTVLPTGLRTLGKVVGDDLGKGWALVARACHPGTWEVEVGMVRVSRQASAI